MTFLSNVRLKNESFATPMTPLMGLSFKHSDTALAGLNKR